MMTGGVGVRCPGCRACWDGLSTASPAIGYSACDGSGWKTPPGLAKNMGSATKKDIEQFFAEVVQALGIPVVLEWSETSPSIFINPRVLLRPGAVDQYVWQAKEEVLHELSHFWVLGHGDAFYSVYAGLVRRFMAGG